MGETGGRSYIDRPGTNYLPGPKIPIPRVKSVVTGRWPAGMPEADIVAAEKRKQPEALTPTADYSPEAEIGTTYERFTGRVVLSDSSAEDSDSSAEKTSTDGEIDPTDID